jgi:hypothetical protein
MAKIVSWNFSYLKNWNNHFPEASKCNLNFNFDVTKENCIKLLFRALQVFVIP